MIPESTGDLITVLDDLRLWLLKGNGLVLDGEWHSAKELFGSAGECRIGTAGS